MIVSPALGLWDVFGERVISVMPTLYHFTSINALRAIAEHGPTVGDVPD